jgi:hypothetical protein
MTLKSFRERERSNRDISFELHATQEGNVATHKKSVSGDNASCEILRSLRAEPATIEGAIKARYVISTMIANGDRAVAGVMAQRLREQIVKVGTRRKRQDSVAVSASEHLLCWNDASLYALISVERVNRHV